MGVIEENYRLVITDQKGQATSLTGEDIEGTVAWINKTIEDQFKRGAKFVSFTVHDNRKKG